MKFYEECKGCLLTSQMKKVRTLLPEEQAERFYREALKLCENIPEEYCAPLLMRDLDAAFKRLYGRGIDYSREKLLFNEAMLKIEAQVTQTVNGDDDPLLKAVKLAMAANYIDFARLTEFNEQAVNEVFAAAERARVDETAYAQFKADLKRAKTLCYLHDNCGEIVLDKVLLRTIKALYPQIELYSVVRGGAIINDVTLDDAAQVNLAEVSRVVSSEAAIPGIYLKETGGQALKLIKGSDVVIAKGLGNLETLDGCGISVYYMFMAKCAHMAERFNVSLMDTVLYHGN